MHVKKLVYGGLPLAKGNKVLIMIHGRGASAADILTLADPLEAQEFSLVAPQATNNTWYPYSFMSPVEANEPWLSGALKILDEILRDLLSQQIPASDIFWLGFSQGACLTLEYITRNATRYGGVLAFTGGLIGETIDEANYKGDFGGTPIFIGTSDPDPHVPVSRVKDTEKILIANNAAVQLKIYPGMGHTINNDEIVRAKKILLQYE